MSILDEKVIEPMAHRFVYGLFYPAILGANLILFIERGGANWTIESLFVWDNSARLVAWGLTLTLFIFDYVGTATEGVPDAPKRTSLLALIDLIAAVLFFYVQAKLLETSAGSETILQWKELWMCLLLLHGLYLGWYIIRLVQNLYSSVTSTHYSKYVTFQIVVIISQLLLFGFVSFCCGIEKAGTYIAVCTIACVGWFIRQVIEFHFAKG